MQPRRALGWTLTAAVVAYALGGSVVAGTVETTNPYWFRDSYTTRSSVDQTMTTAAVNTAGTGTVQLPYAPMQAAFDPAGTFALVAMQTGLDAYVFDGIGVSVLQGWNLSGIAATGVAWLKRGAAFAVSSTSQVAAYGIDSGGQVLRAAETAASGVEGLAPGPASLPFGVLAATVHGARVYEAQGTALVEVSGGPSGLSGNLGVASTSGGAVAATWQREAVQIWAWDGAAYLPVSQWTPPTPPRVDGPVAGVAFFPQGGGYWVLTAQGDLLAYAYGSTGLQSLGGMGTTLSPMPVGLASGWGASAVAALRPTGWTYEDAQAGVFGRDAPRSLTGQTWPSYAAQGVLQSVVLSAGHQVSEVRMEDADCAAGKAPPDCTRQAQVPGGTTVTYQVSTDGCATWTSALPFTNVKVPAGDQLCYRLILGTSDPTETPVVDVTNLYELATEQTTGSVAALLCVGSNC